jgi:hypothetical protein
MEKDFNCSLITQDTNTSTTKLFPAVLLFESASHILNESQNHIIWLLKNKFLKVHNAYNLGFDFTLFLLPLSYSFTNLLDLFT